MFLFETTARSSNAYININYMTQLLRKISNWYFLHKALPYWCILAMDCMTVYVSGLFVYYFQHGGLELAQRFWQVTLGLSAVSYTHLDVYKRQGKGYLRPQDEHR